MARRRLLGAALLLVAAACGGGESVTIQGAWARTTAAGQTTGAVYFDLTVTDDDVLVGASVSADVAARAEIHEVVAAELDADTSGEMGGSDGLPEMEGAMTMREVEGGLVLVGGETVAFEPGGYHVMLFDLAAPLVDGDQIEVTLELAEAGATTVSADVAATAP